jgi:PAS domain S-box-containing protein
MSREAVMGQKTVDLKLWDISDSQKLNEVFKKNNKVDNYAAYFIPRNGKKRHVLLSLAPILIKGEPYIISTGIDITDRIIAEQKLVESEERFRAILQNLSDSIWIVDKNTTILYESPSAQNMFGYREGELQGKKGLDLVHPDDRAEVLNEFDQSLKNIEGFIPTLFRVRTAVGRYIFVEGISNNRIDHPAIKGIILTLRDVTERIVKDKELRESEQKFRNIFNSSTDAIIISSLDQEILEVNDVVVKLSGYNREELLLKKTTDLASEKSILEINKRFAQLKVNETVPPTEIDFVIGTGVLLATEMTSRIIDYKGEKALLTLIRDITERKKLEKTLIDTIIQTEEKEREKMAADLHDEVGPLLSSMKMYLNSLLETKDAAKSLYISDQLKMLIKESITAVREISNDLSPHILNNYGLTAAVRAAVETNLQFIKIILKENLENRRFPPNIEIIFYRIIRELINNTIKHANAKSIDISLFHSEEKMMLYYSDDGKGFDWQMVINSTRKGLGIMNILSRLKSMNGQYNIQTSPGKGFYFELTTPL